MSIFGFSISDALAFMTCFLHASVYIFCVALRALPSATATMRTLVA